MKKLMNLSLAVAAVVIAQVALNTRASAEPVGGATCRTTSVSAHTTDEFTARFYGGESAAVTVSGDYDTDLDLYLYDENGNLIAKDDDNTDQCVVRFRPNWTGPFTIRIVNRGSVYNHYTICVR